VLAALAAGTRPAAAQVVVEPEAKLTPAQTTVRAALYQLRDTLLPVEAASARIARDLSTASDPALRSRARLMVQRCRAATVQTDSARRVVAREALPNPDPLGARAALDRALGELRGQLQQCTAQFTELSDPAKAEELRGYGIGRGQRVQNAIGSYRPTASQYFRVAFSQQYWPNMVGAGAIPSAQ
jgi:hypothetical protein